MTARSLLRPLRRIVERDPPAALIAGRVADLARHRLEWPAGVQRGTRRRAVEAEVAIILEGDADGDVLDGLIEFDPASEAFLSIALRTSGGADASAIAHPFGGATGRAAASLQSGRIVANWFRHRRDERALPAVHRDLGAFLAPSDLLRRAPLAGDDGLPLQFVHAGGSGVVTISGSLAWRGARLTRGRVAAGEIDLDTAALAVGASAELAWSARLEGSWDLVLFAAAEGRITARLAASDLERSRGAVGAEAGIALEGPAAAVRALIEVLEAPLEPLLRSIERAGARAPTLRALFRAETAEELERLLASERATAAIREWLERIHVDVDLRRRLRELLVDLVDEAAGETVDALAERIDPAIAAVRDAVREHRARMRAAKGRAEEAVRVAVALELARTAARLRRGEVALEVTLDPARHRKAFRALTRGDWSKVLRLAREDGSIEVGGSLRSRGSLEIESSLSILILRKSVGVGSRREQSWQSELEADGTLTISTRGALEVWSRSWRSLSSIGLFLDARAVESLAPFGTGAGRRSRRPAAAPATLRLEWTIESRPTVPALRALEARLRRARLLGTGASLVEALPLETGRHSNRPFGELEISVLSSLGAGEIRLVAAAPPETASQEFARALLEEVPMPREIAAAESRGLPIFAWSDVLAKVGAAAINEKRSAVVFSDEDGRQVRVRRSLLPPITLLARLVLLFGELCAGLRELDAAEGKDHEAIARRFRANQQRALRRASAVLTATTLARADLGFALFRTLRRLAGDPPAEIIVLRRDDGRRFVLPAEGQEG
ncbi:MAG TPA: hypothetical protein VMS56_02510 [Thermoanaerobaculia bacterium]|nr:hypothetical protein [Thermoanaerobaculia bacterium]